MVFLGSIISVVGKTTVEIIEPYNKGARRGQLKKHLAGASLLPAELVKWFQYRDENAKLDSLNYVYLIQKDYWATICNGTFVKNEYLEKSKQLKEI